MKVVLVKYFVSVYILIFCKCSLIKYKKNMNEVCLLLHRANFAPLFYTTYPITVH